MWIYTPKTKKGLSKKLLHNWYGSYRIVKQLSPAHYQVRTCDNKSVRISVYSNCMKRYFNPTARPIEPLDDLDVTYLEIVISTMQVSNSLIPQNLRIEQKLNLS